MHEAQLDGCALTVGIAPPTPTARRFARTSPPARPHTRTSGGRLYSDGRHGGGGGGVPGGVPGGSGGGRHGGRVGRPSADDGPRGGGRPMGPASWARPEYSPRERVGRDARDRYP